MKQTVVDKEEKTESNTNCCSKIYNLSLLKKPEFSLLILSNMIFHLGVYTVFGFTMVNSFNNQYLFNLFMDSQDRAILFGISPEKASFLFSAMGIANCLRRVICGKIVDSFVFKFGDKNVVYVSITILMLNGLCEYLYQNTYFLLKPMIFSNHPK